MFIDSSCMPNFNTLIVVVNLSALPVQFSGCFSCTWPHTLQGYFSHCLASRAAVRSTYAQWHSTCPLKRWVLEKIPTPILSCTDLTKNGSDRNELVNLKAKVDTAHDEKWCNSELYSQHRTHVQLRSSVLACVSFIYQEVILYIVVIRNDNHPVRSSDLLWSSSATYWLT